MGETNIDGASLLAYINILYEHKPNNFSKLLLSIIYIELINKYFDFNTHKKNGIN